MDTLLKVETDGAVRVAISKRHRSGGTITAAQPVETVEIAPRARIAFDQAEDDMLLTGLKDDLKIGQTLRLTFYFEKSKPLTVDAAILVRAWR